MTSADAKDERLLERSDSVLWSLSPDGIVLHNVETRTFLELDQAGYRLWALLDGARIVEDVIERTTSPDGDSETLRAVVETLYAHGFITRAERAQP